MLKVGLYHDRSKATKTGSAFLYISICKKGKRALISLDIKLALNQWNGSAVVNHPLKNKLNVSILNRLDQAQSEALRLECDGLLAGKSVTEAAELIREAVCPEYREKKKRERDNGKRLLPFYERYAGTKTNKGTRSVYECTLRKLKEYGREQETGLDTLIMDNVNADWLHRFEQYCLKTERKNTANIHLRNLRAAFNAAIDEGLCNNYPFRKFRIRQELTTDKSMTSAELRLLFDAKCNNDGERFAVDMFKLMFCLIGINGVDLFNAAPPVRGRLEYDRMKTGRHYSVKLEPEAEEIIDRYRGSTSLLNLKERYGNYKTLLHRAAVSLKKVGLINEPGRRSKGKPLFPDICYGCARTSWATIAQDELDISKECIAAALGHHTVDVTDTYTRTKWKTKVDKANRAILDLVFSPTNPS